uniref:Lin-15A/B-like domain-containing protein n=1 Tax=Caenorhabditis japonica TaxID=281687 RepID=A0A8R1E2P2_CAEJA
MHTFKRWERFGRNDNLAMSESELKIERRKMAEKLSSTMPEEVEEPCEQSCFSDSSPSSSQDLYQYNEVVEIRDPREEMTYDDDVEYIRSISPPRHEIQQIQSTASYLKRPRNENCMSPSPSIHELRQVQSTIPYRRRPRDEIADIVNSSSIRLRNVSGIPEKVKPKPPPQPKAKPIVALPFVAGLSSWLCIVCHQRVPPSQLRAVGANDAYIIIYLSMMKGQYSMEKAKDTARFSQYKCCVNHLTNIVSIKNLFFFL